MDNMIFCWPQADVFDSYNSVMFLKIQANIYSVVPVDQFFLDMNFYNISSLNSTRDFHPDIDVIVNSAVSIRAYFYETQRFERLSPSDCCKVYSSQYVSSWVDVLIVQGGPVSAVRVLKKSNKVSDKDYTLDTDTDGSYLEERKKSPQGRYANKGPRADIVYAMGLVGQDGDLTRLFKTMPFLSEPSQSPSNEWQCRPRLNRLDQQQYSSNTNLWNPYARPVLYCLSEKVHEECQLNFNHQFVILVTSLQI